MARLDPRFRAEDVIRIWKTNLALQDKRATLAFFWSLNPQLNPKREIIDLFLGLLARLPVIGSFFDIFLLTGDILDAIVTVAELFELEEPETDEELVARVQQLTTDLEEALEMVLEERKKNSELMIEVNDLIGDKEFLESINDSLREEINELQKRPTSDILDTARTLFDALRETLRLADNFATTAFFTRIPREFFELVRDERRP